MLRFAMCRATARRHGHPQEPRPTLGGGNDGARAVPAVSQAIGPTRGGQQPRPPPSRKTRTRDLLHQDRGAGDPLIAAWGRHRARVRRDQGAKQRNRDRHARDAFQPHHEPHNDPPPPHVVPPHEATPCETRPCVKSGAQTGQTIRGCRTGSGGPPRPTPGDMASTLSRSRRQTLRRSCPSKSSVRSVSRRVRVGLFEWLKTAALLLRPES
jgi:hypothetical protein